MIARAALPRVLVAVVVVALAACGSIDLGSHGTEPRPEGGLPEGGGPTPEGGPVPEAGPPQDADASVSPAYIKASNTRQDARFGIVALDGDTLAVGAPGDSSAASGVNADQNDATAADAGAVYVFKRTAGTWAQEAYLKASNTRAGALFGVSVALRGDTLVVGAYHESSNGIAGQSDTSAPNAGAVYVFRRTAGTWAQEAYLKASNARANAEFGSGVTLSNDTIVIGSPGETSNATGVDGDPSDTSLSGAGAAYLFTRTGTTWSQQVYFKASNPHADALFGSAVSLDADTLAVGSLHEPSKATGVNGDQNDTSVPGAGAAYVFERTAGTWAQQAYLKSSNTKSTAELTGGFSIGLSLSGNTVAVGEYIEASNATGINGNQSDISAPNAGAVYVFARSGAAWAQQAYVKASNARALALFGYSVALSGDTLIVGSIQESSGAKGVSGNQSDTSAPGSGAAYTFERTGTIWSQKGYFKATNTRVDAVFGYSVAQSADTFAIGSVFESSSAVGVNGDAGSTAAPTAGAVYVFR